MGDKRTQGEFEFVLGGGWQDRRCDEGERQE